MVAKEVITISVKRFNSVRGHFWESVEAEVWKVQGDIFVAFDITGSSAKARRDFELATGTSDQALYYGKVLREPADIEDMSKAPRLTEAMAAFVAGELGVELTKAQN